MLTISTHAAIAVLQDIASGDTHRSANFSLAEGEFKKILKALTDAQLICLLPVAKEYTLPSYKLSRPLHQLTLLDLLEATGDPIHFNLPTPESYYNRYGEAAKKMGIINQMTRRFLADIHLTDW